MKILVGCSSPPDHGAGILSYVIELCHQLLRRDIEVHLASPAPKDWTWVKTQGIHHVVTGQDNDPVETARFLLEYIRDHRIDGVINNDNSLVQSIAPGLRCPFIAIGHLGRTSIASLACYRWQWSDYVVAISNDMQHSFVTKHRVPLIKCPIIYNGVADPGHNGDYSRKDPDELRVVFAGGYNRRLKGADHVLTAAQKGEMYWQGIRLDWYGGGVPDEVIRRLARLANVHVHGKVTHEEMINALRRADVLLFPSRAEGCPMAMLEAMSHAVVVIASDGEGAMRWLVTSGQDGYICHLARWPEQMLECLAHLRDFPKTLMEMKRATRHRFLAEFQSFKMAEELLHLIDNPTVDRSYPPHRFDILRWRTPLRPDGLKAPLLDRVYIRSGHLRLAGVLVLG